MECSGLICHYSLNLNCDNNLFYDIHINTNRNRVPKNYMFITINPVLLTPTNLNPIREYVRERFENLGGLLTTAEAGPSNIDVLLKKAEIGDLYPKKITISKYTDARGIIDNLFRYREMTAAQRADIEIALRELEKCGEYASRRKEQISVAQKDLIQSMISPYIENIKAEISDEVIIKCFLDITSSFLVTMSEKTPKEIRAFLPSILAGKFGLTWGGGSFSLIPEAEIKREKSSDFYDSLIFISRFYISMGNLEDAIEQLGEGLPSEAIIQQTILEAIK